MELFINSCLKIRHSKKANSVEKVGKVTGRAQFSIDSDSTLMLSSSPIEND